MINVTREAIAMFPHGLVPLAEQQRTAARVEELPPWCDPLEALLHQTHRFGAHLHASTRHHILAA